MSRKARIWLVIVVLLAILAARFVNPPRSGINLGESNLIAAIGGSTQVEVKQGDTWYKIVRRVCKVESAEIVALNGGSDYIRTGQIVDVRCK
jgi:hypothetical protein